MNIKEAERLSGVSSRNIRFYEQKGLVMPDRNAENDYREYSEQEIHRLKLIRALRMVDMPLDQIREVVDGRVELRRAATLQKEKLEEQIKQLKTVIKFCEELAETDPDSVSEVLLRMDQPENEKFFSKQWRTDYAEKVKSVCGPLLAGLLPLLISLLLYVPMLFAGAFAHGYVFLLCLLILLCWYWLGKRLYHEKRWLVNAALFALFPAISLVRLLLDAPMDWNGTGFHTGEEMLQLYYLQYCMPLEILNNPFKLHNWHYLMFFAINLGIFGLGMLLQRKNKGGKSSFWGRLFDKRPVLCVVTGAVLAAFVLIAPAIVTDLRPTQFHLDSLQANYAYGDNCLAKTEDGVVWFETSEEFARLARFDEWEQKYTWIGYGNSVLTIDKDSVKSGANLEFYDGNCVKVHVRGFLGPGKTSYFRVPDGVIEELEEYIKTHTVRDGSAWE